MLLNEKAWKDDNTLLKLKEQLWAPRRQVVDDITALCNILGRYKIYKDNYSINNNDHYYLYFSPEELQYLLQKLKGIKAKYIRKRGRELNFYLDQKTIEDLVKEVQQKIDSKYEKDLEAFNSEVDKLNIDRYKPDQKTIEKLKAYRDKGSMVNVKAIKSIDKVLTYLYGAAILGWDDLFSNIKSIIWDIAPDRKTSEYLEDMATAISNKVKADSQLSDTRSALAKKKGLPDTNGLITLTDKSCWLPKSILLFFVDNNIPVSFKRRTEGGRFDRNGAQWTEIENFTAYPNTEKAKDLSIAVHTDEGGRIPNTYTLIGWSNERVSAKKIIEILEKILK